MKISQHNSISRVNNCSYCASFKRFNPKAKLQLLRDVFVRNSDKGLAEIAKIQSGVHGTICKGSIPLQSFRRQFKSETDYMRAVERGISTNKQGFAYSFLKTIADNPVSTSFVHDCSVMYLYNSQKNTHFLYHVHPETSKTELDYMVKTFMQEGYTNASIVPGGKFWTSSHKKYLPTLFNVLKENNPNAVVKVYHNSSFLPEIVGYHGEMFEILNDEVSNQIINGQMMYDKGQATFKISDIKSGSTLVNIHYAEKEQLPKLKKALSKREYDSEIKKVFNDLINKKMDEIKKIESFDNKEDLLNYIFSKYKDTHLSKQEFNHNYYGLTIENKLREFGYE